MDALARALAFWLIGFVIVGVIGGTCLWVASKLLRVEPPGFFRCCITYGAAYVVAGLVALVLFCLLRHVGIPQVVAIVAVGIAVHIFFVGRVLHVPFLRALVLDGLAIGALTAVIAGMFLVARSGARRIQDANNLKTIGVGIVIYQLLNNETLPKDLSELYPGYVTERERFVSPQDARPLTMAGDLRCSYQYVGDHLSRDSPALRRLRSWPTGKSIIACTRKGVFEGGRNCLFADGHVEWLNEAEIAVAYEQMREELQTSPEDDEALRAFYQIGG